jgi:Holliday junction resolvase RusA-like endonuclease
VVIGTAFIVPGKPIPWQRARRMGKRYFTRPDVAAHQEEIRKAWEAAGSRHLGNGPLAMVARFWLPRPATHYGKGRNAEVIKVSAPRFPIGRPPGSPDIDNLVKIIDALNGLAWEDDSQIIRLCEVSKVYVAERELPRSYFEFWQVRGPEEEPPSMLEVPVPRIVSVG